MNNQKKIDEILYSIQELILEAQNEKKLDFVQTNEVIELNKINPSKTDNPENNQDYTDSFVNKLIKKNEIKITELEGEPTKNNDYLNGSWKNLNFKKCQEKDLDLVDFWLEAQSYFRFSSPHQNLELGSHRFDLEPSQ